jgi:glycosyltransferase involved in cell wall biosynthesis
LITNFHPHPGYGGGHHTYIRSLCESALAEEFRLALASPPASTLSRWAREAGIRRYEVDFPGSLREIPGILRSIFRLQAVYREFGFDLVHANGSRDHWIAAYWKLLFRQPVPLVRTRHALRRIAGDPVHHFLDNRLTQANIFVSQALLEQSGAAGRLKNALVIPHGVDLQRFQPWERQADTARELGIEEGDFVFGSVAGTGRYKRVDQFLRAFARTRLERPAKILVLGDEDNGRRLTALARELGLEKLFIFGGYRADVRPVISLFDVGFVLSDAVETSSFAAKEMLAMGVPLISSSFCGLVENVDHGDNGFLVHPHRLEEISAAIAAFARMSPAELARFRRAARAKAERCFSREAFIRRLGQVYREVLGASAARGWNKARAAPGPGGRTPVAS